MIRPQNKDDLIYGVHYNVVQAYPVTILFYYSILQYISMAIIFSQGKPFRTNIINNFWFTINIISLILATLVMYSGRFDRITLFLQLVEMPESDLFLKLFCLVGGANILVCYVLEQIINSDVDGSDTNDENENKTKIFAKLKKFLKIDYFIDKIDVHYGVTSPNNNEITNKCKKDVESGRNSNEEIFNLFDGILKEKVE